VLICHERKILLAGWGLMIGVDLFREKNTVGWWLIIQINKAMILISPLKVSSTNH
jgi:hypothetical protein